MRGRETLMVTEIKFATWDQVGVDDAEVEIVFDSGDTSVTVVTKFGASWDLERLPWAIGDLVTVDWESGSIT